MWNEKKIRFLFSVSVVLAYIGLLSFPRIVYGHPASSDWGLIWFLLFIPFVWIFVIGHGIIEYIFKHRMKNVQTSTPEFLDRKRYAVVAGFFGGCGIATILVLVLQSEMGIAGGIISGLVIGYSILKGKLVR